jgi:hemerythrin
MEQNRGRHEVGKVLAFLERYVVEHFAAEERLMARHAYPQAGVHKLKHVEFVKAFVGLKGEFEKMGPTAGLAVKLNRTVCGWLREHIGGADRLLGQFLVSKGQGDAAA